MGSLVSSISEEAKNFKELTKEEQTPGGSSQVLVTPTTPENNAFNPKIAALVDPRSPSVGVSRTPLEIEERNRRIERTRLKNQFNKENNLAVPLLSGNGGGGGIENELVTTPTGPQAKEFPPGFDPRSPNPEINRTPIALNQNVPVVGRKMFQNQENLD